MTRKTEKVKEANPRKSVNNIYDNEAQRQKQREVITENILYESNPKLTNQAKLSNNRKDIITDNVLYE